MHPTRFSEDVQRHGSPTIMQNRVSRPLSMGSPPTRLLFVLQALCLFVHVASAVYCTDARMRSGAVHARDPAADVVIDKTLTTLRISSQLLTAPVGSPVVQYKHSTCGCSGNCVHANGTLAKAINGHTTSIYIFPEPGSSFTSGRHCRRHSTDYHYHTTQTRRSYLQNPYFTQCCFPHLLVFIRLL